MTSTTAKIIADTEGVIPEARITTFEIYAPRFLLAEINTHRVISKSAQSSRAIPVKKRIAAVTADPYIPAVFGKNQPGMQAQEALSDADSIAAKYRWERAAHDATISAELLANLGVHKQLANRVLEPFAYFYGVLTATEWDNFWQLRRSAEAQPEFRELADKMFDAYAASTPRVAPHHLPYCDTVPAGTHIELLLKISAARCARVSYKTFDGKLSIPEEDVALCDRLLVDGHLSPFDHPAACDELRYDQHWMSPGDHRQYWGWIPYRVDIEEKLGVKCRRDSYAKICQHD